MGSLRPSYDAQIRKWTNVASHTLFVYDLILTSQEEYRYIWKANWSIGKLLYILVRYPFNTVVLMLALYADLAPYSAITPSFCETSFRWGDFGGWAQLAIVQVVIGTRTAVLYDARPVVVFLLGILGIGSAINILVLELIFTKLSSYGRYPVGSPLLGCYRKCRRCIQLGKWLLFPMMIFDTVIFILTLLKYHEYSKRPTYMKNSLLQILYRDGFMYYAVIFSSVFTNVVILHTARPSLMEVMTPILRSILGIMCGRMLLNVRGAILQQPSDGFSLTTLHHKSTCPSLDVGAWKVANDDPMGPSQGTISYLDNDDPGPLGHLKAQIDDTPGVAFEITGPN